MEETDYFDNSNDIKYQPLFEKYKPKTTKDIIGNRKGINTIVATASLTNQVIISDGTLYSTLLYPTFESSSYLYKSNNFIFWLPP